ncbi:MAG: alpha/beta hydrolase [Ancrocorticia sp.]|jgi:pimeloyl-ACP methyl ester carboxylesterase|nr:alpha/beta hydrolase [Ancrocorticia sp.]MCI2193950.1 alpha/beta hydrolase [Ancrocorticia sp.]MCI2198571.1 alpha/beta hydrolase [Ancrocorticia sp.]
MARFRRFGFALLAGAFALTACMPSWPSDQSSDSAGVPIEIEMPSAPVNLKSYYEQDLSWQTCSESYECATVQVPLDYDDPSGTAINIALMKRPAASGDPIGTLFINPGGPGGSGIDMVAQADYILSDTLLENFDIVGFDPRGVGQSTPVDCVDDAALNRILDANYYGADAQQRSENDVAAVRTGCEKNSSDILTYLQTENVARDLDILRDAVGDPQLYYLGMSYGTFIGEEYAELFPKNVGRVVLDGVMNPTLGMAGLVYAQANAFETALERYMSFCLDSVDCPFTGSTDEALEQLHQLFLDAGEKAVPTDDADRPLTQSMMFQGIILPLYSRINWYMLTSALTELVEKGTGTQLKALNDAGTSRQDDGTFADNSVEANWAINCVDYPSASDEVWQEMGQRLVSSGNVFGDFMATGEDLCKGWPGNPDEDPGPFTAQGAAPIVLIGTRYDPATPYRWAEEMHSMMENSVLLTYEGDGHTAYGQGVSCIQDSVDDYLLNGTVPEDGLTCAAQNN